jgi:hypothetical protein
MASMRHSPPLRAAPADSAHPLPFPACQEKPVGEESCVSAPHARISVTIYRSCAPMSSRSPVSSACGAVLALSSPFPAQWTLARSCHLSSRAARTVTTSWTRGKSEKKGPKNLQAILTNHSKHSNIRGTKPKTKPFLMLRLPNTLLIESQMAHIHPLTIYPHWICRTVTCRPRPPVHHRGVVSLAGNPQPTWDFLLTWSQYRVFRREVGSALGTSEQSTQAFPEGVFS